MCSTGSSSTRVASGCGTVNSAAARQNTENSRCLGPTRRRTLATMRPRSPKAGCRNSDRTPPVIQTTERPEMTATPALDLVTSNNDPVPKAGVSAPILFTASEVAFSTVAAVGMRRTTMHRWTEAICVVLTAARRMYCLRVLFLGDNPGWAAPGTPL